VVKFIHEWLPLQDRHHVQSTSALHLCPSCNQHPETVEHFLTCPHPARQQVWTELHEALHKHQIQNSVSNIFHETLAYRLYQGHQAPTSLHLHHLPHDLAQLYQSQERLGWKQLYYGRFVIQWIPILTQYHPQLNGLHYITKIAVLIWQSVLKVWGLWNTHLHPGNPEQEDCSQLQAAVNQTFFEAHQDPLLQALVDHLDPDHIMHLPTRRIRQWVTKSHHHLRAHAKAVKLQARLHTQDMHTYLLPPAPYPILHR